MDTLIDDCYSWGDVTATYYAGGFAYYVSATPENCYSIGAVTGSSGVGGFSQLGGSSAIACYWDTETSGTETSSGGTGKTTAEMKRPATYDGWDFETIWNDMGWSAGVDGVAGYLDTIDVGYDRFEGEDLCVFADGRPLGTFTVVDGELDGLNEDDYTTIIAGLNYYSIYESFPLIPYPEYTSIRNVKIDFYESMGCHVGVSIDDSVDWIFSYDDFATAIDPVTEVKSAPFMWGSTREPIIYLHEWDPIPLTVRGIYIKLTE